MHCSSLNLQLKPGGLNFTPINRVSTALLFLLDNNIRLLNIILISITTFRFPNVPSPQHLTSRSEYSTLARPTITATSTQWTTPCATARKSHKETLPVNKVLILSTYNIIGSSISYKHNNIMVNEIKSRVKEVPLLDGIHMLLYRAHIKTK